MKSFQKTLKCESIHIHRSLDPSLYYTMSQVMERERNLGGGNLGLQQLSFEFQQQQLRKKEKEKQRPFTDTFFCFSLSLSAMRQSAVCFYFYFIIIRFWFLVLVSRASIFTSIRPLEEGERERQMLAYMQTQSDSASRKRRKK